MGWEDDPVVGSGAAWQNDPVVIPQQQPVRFMDEPTGVERFLAGINLPEWMQNMRGTAPARVLQGAADPMIGLMQAGANLLPDSTGIPQAVNKRVGDLERDYESQRKAHYQAQTGQTDAPGFDAMRFVGNAVSPVNALGAGRLMEATTMGRRAIEGAKLGAAGGLVQPVADADQPGASYWGEKAPQVIGGTLAGATLTPLLGKVGDAVVRRLSAAPRIDPGQADIAIVNALKEMGQDFRDIPVEQLEALRTQVATALQAGKKLDPAAALRKSDFESLGMQPTLGQITREPMQFARERNLRGVEGAGEPLSARFSAQGSQLQDRLSGPSAGAKDSYNAGTLFMDSLKGTDDLLRRHVSGLYGEARSAAGKDLDVPLQGLAQDFANISERYGSNVPDAIRSRFASFGMDPANPTNQRRVFTLETANGLLQDINKLDPRHTNPPVSSALGEIRNALRSAIENADPTGGPFAPAVRAAAERFKLHDAVPALKAAANGDIAPDDFVRRFIVNGKTDEVRGLSDVLKRASPEAWQEARAQIGDTLKRAAFGENVTGDKPFASERYMSTVRRIGKDKLLAFFSPQEVDQLMTVGRVGAYIHQAPNAAAVSTSNSQAGLINAVGMLGTVGSVAKKIAGPVKSARDSRNALRAAVPVTDAPLGEEPRNYLSYLLGVGAIGSGAAFGSNGRNRRVDRRP